MNKIKNYVLGAGVVAVLMLTMLVAIPQAKAAEYPNILVGSNLTIGSAGQDVVVLQALLSELGYLNVPFSIPLGYYGTMTQSAVSRYQASLGVTPTAGYFGPATKIAMHANFGAHGWLSMLGW